MSVQCSKKFAKPNCSPQSVKRSVPLNVCVRDLEHIVFSENAHHCMALLCLLTSAADIICVCVCLNDSYLWPASNLCFSSHSGMHWCMRLRAFSPSSTSGSNSQYWHRNHSAASHQAMQLQPQHQPPVRVEITIPSERKG